MVATAAAYAVSGASFPTLLPAVAFAVAGWIETVMRRHLTVAGWTGFVGSAFFMLSFVLALEVILGFNLTQYKILVLFPAVGGQGRSFVCERQHLHTCRARRTAHRPG